MAVGADLFDAVPRPKSRRELEFGVVGLDDDPVPADRPRIDVGVAAVACAIEIRVGELSAVQHVIARSADQRVVAIVAMQRVCPGSANKRVIPVVAPERVCPSFAENRIVAPASGDGIRVAASLDSDDPVECCGREVESVASGAAFDRDARKTVGADQFDTGRRPETGREHDHRIVAGHQDAVDAGCAGIHVEIAAVARAVEVSVGVLSAVQHVTARPARERVVAAARRAACRRRSRREGCRSRASP